MTPPPISPEKEKCGLCGHTEDDHPYRHLFSPALPTEITVLPGNAIEGKLESARKKSLLEKKHPELLTPPTEKGEDGR